jgi:hypothetical protein
MSTLTFFGISAIVLIVLIGIRVLELMIGRDIIPTRVRDGLDAKVVRVIATGSRFVSKIRTTCRQQLRKIPIFILHTLVAVWAWALKQTLKAITMAHGRADGKTRRTMVAYLDAVTSYEKQLRS